MLLALLSIACQASSDESRIATAPRGRLAHERESAEEITPEPVAMPAGEVIIRSSCFGGGEEELMRKSSGARGSTRSSGPSALFGAAPRTASSAPSSAGSAKSSASPKKRSKPSPRAESAPAPAMSMSPPPPPPADMAPSEPSPGVIGNIARDRSDADMVMEREEAPRSSSPELGWGDTIYLSNDDSMSLASAQRVLWSVENGQTPKVSEIRPHELLNYFSFDTIAPARERTFSVLGAAAQEGDDLKVALSVKGATPPRQPLDLTLVVDRSCSMRAEGRMEYTQRGLNLLDEQLVRGDRVDLVLFDSGVCTAVEGYVVGRDEPDILRSAVAKMKPTSSTDLDAGLKEAYRIQASRKDAASRNRRVMLLTDAQLNSGDVNPDTVSEIGKRLEADGIRLTGVGVGRDFRDDVLDMLTEKGKGAYVYLGSDAVVDRIFGPGFDSLTQTIAHDVQFSLDLPDSLALVRFYGEEASTDAADVQPINYFAGTSQVFFQELRVRDGRVRPDDMVNLMVAYTDATSGERRTEDFRTSVGDLLNGDRHNLDKADALMAWSDTILARAMGDRGCGEAIGTYRQRAAKLSDDAEVGYLNGITGRLCGVDLSDPQPGVVYKVRLDSDVPIAEVGISCAGQTLTERLSSGSNIARFTSVPAGECTLVLQGPVEMRQAVVVPATGGQVRCVLRGGRVKCS